MLGDLPRTLTVGGRVYRIRSDFRSVLRIIAAYGDDELSDAEKIYVCLRQLYADFKEMPADDYAEAYERASWFLACGQPSTGREPRKTVDWAKDEQLIFPAVNKVAGKEVRLEKYVHWWTFMGYFQSIDREDTYGYVLMLRQKRAKGKQFEKWENEFWNNNREMCDLNMTASSGADAESALAEIYKELLQKGG